MSASWPDIFHEMLFGSLSLIWSLARIIIPLMIVIELMLKFKIAEKLARKMGWFCRLIGITKDAVLPLIVGTLLGVTYGAGLLIELQRQKPLSRKDFALIGVFLYSCHGLIETSFLFVMSGASLIFVVFVRLLFAVIITMIAARLPFLWRIRGST